MPLALETGSGTVCLKIANTGEVGFGGEPTAGYPLTIAGWTLVDTIMQFRNNTCGSQACVTTPILLSTLPGSVTAIDVTSYVTGGRSFASGQYVVAMVNSGDSITLSSNLNHVIVYDQRTGGASQAISISIW